MSKYEFLIAGGGIAGASLAIRLALKGVRVAVIEKDDFPRQKLCGEFVSPECVEHFRRLGVYEELELVEPETITSTRFIAKSGKSVSVPSKWFSSQAGGAIGISRFLLDKLLIDRAVECGADVFSGAAIRQASLKDNKLASVVFRQGNADKEIEAGVFVDATGRARALSALAERSMKLDRERSKVSHVAFKTHLENVELDAGVCEIYFFDGGYGGLSMVEGGVANHCFLVEASRARKYRGDADKLFRDLVLANPRARESMGIARKRFDWLGVSVPTFGKQEDVALDNLIQAGDSAAFIDPFTGSGMLMALEASEMLFETVKEAGAVGITDALQIKSRFLRKHTKAIRNRLLLCSLFHRLSFSTWSSGAVVSAVKINSRILRRLATLTRPAA